MPWKTIILFFDKIMEKVNLAVNRGTSLSEGEKGFWLVLGNFKIWFIVYLKSHLDVPIFLLGSLRINLFINLSTGLFTTIIVLFVELETHFNQMGHG